jgi:hypothetical protein
MVGLNLQFRRQTIYLLFQMIFALACGFSNSFSLPKKKKGLNWDSYPGPLTV